MSISHMTCDHGVTMATKHFFSNFRIVHTQEPRLQQFSLLLSNHTQSQPHIGQYFLSIPIYLPQPPDRGLLHPAVERCIE
jgi:hypothetical protein